MKPVPSRSAREISSRRRVSNAARLTQPVSESTVAARRAAAWASALRTATPARSANAVSSWRSSSPTQRSPLKPTDSAPSIGPLSERRSGTDIPAPTSRIAAVPLGRWPSRA